MRLFSCWISILILPFVREIAGATYLLLFPNENQELPCPLSPNQYHTDWWVGSACSSLLTFEQMGLTSYEWPPKKSYSTNWERFVHICTSGGIFACRAWTDGEMTRQTPLLNNPEHCRHFHFFIVAKINESGLLQISLGVMGSILVVGGLIAFLCWKKNPRGKPSEPHQRDRTATEMKEEECSPYAISSHSDVFGNEVVYSLATSPGVNPNRDFLQNSSTASGTQAGENVETYAVINKVCS
ncbi:uncharacterized protein LOC123027719 isoform X4 [Varanus komodoensis]|uniref:uncharacterized protein LOC123027719 isoform X4 n=1 Tax=Varanus komodoensis TaxID=61221 RepID=UPI001CF79A4C|nr:uncharacterized protein LOC123027719 isoform X4 [Varanus komodoensis]